MTTEPAQLPKHLPDPPEDGSDELANKEASALANLDDISKRADHSRSEKLKDHVILAGISIFWLIVALFVFAVVFLGWHMLMPAKWQWLDESSVSQLKAAISGIALSGAAQSFAKKYLK